MHIRILPFQSRLGVSWRLVGNEITWSGSRLVVCARLRSNATLFHPRLCSNCDFSATFCHRATADNRWDSCMKFGHSLDKTATLHKDSLSVRFLLV